MEAITFTPAQVHVFNLVSHIKSSLGLEHLRQQLAAFYAKQVDDEMDRLWENGQWDEKRMQELRGSHFRTRLLAEEGIVQAQKNAVKQSLVRAFDELKNGQARHDARNLFTD